MPRLALYLLGPPRIEFDGVPVKLDSRKGVAPLAYLAVVGVPQRRDSTAKFLWPDLDSSRVRAALRRTLYALRRALGGRWLTVTRDEIGLIPSAAPVAKETGSWEGHKPALWADASQFSQLLAERATHEHCASDICTGLSRLLGGREPSHGSR